MPTVQHMLVDHFCQSTHPPAKGEEVFSCDWLSPGEFLSTFRFAQQICLASLPWQLISESHKNSGASRITHLIWADLHVLTDRSRQCCWNLLAALLSVFNNINDIYLLYYWNHLVRMCSNFKLLFAALVSVSRASSHLPQFCIVHI